MAGNRVYAFNGDKLRVSRPCPLPLNIYLLSCCLIDDEQFGCSRDELIRAVGAAKIEARRTWEPMHLQPLYVGCERYGGDVAKDLFRRGICLPSSSSLTEEEQSYLVNAVRRTAGLDGLNALSNEND